FTATTEDINGLAGGDYDITITDNNGCTLTATITVGQTANTLAQTSTVVNTGCGVSNGAINLTVTGGIAPLTHAWTGPGGFTATTEDINGLAGGDYDITITDNNGCTMTATITVGQAANTLAQTSTVVNTGCGVSNGSINLAVTGGAAPLTYAWTGPGGFTATTEDINALAGGDYDVTITDNNGCTLTTTITVGQTANTLAQTSTVVNTGCGVSNGSINLAVTGGAAPLTYAWTGPGGFTATTEDINGLAGGDYDITITDNN